MFRLLPIFGSDPRATAEIVNGIMNGKTNNHGTVTLATGNATTTTIVDERISPDTKIVLVPFSDAAEADSAPYGAFQDSTDQTAANTTTAYSITFDTTDYSNGVYLSNSSRINFRNYGIYNLQFSVQLKNTTNDTQDVDIWFSKNGTNIDKSNSRFSLPARKSSGDPSHLIAALNFYLELQVGDYVELKWRVSDIGVSIEQYGTSTSPTRPAVPSVIFTAQYVAPSASTNVYVSAQTKGSATLTHFANSTSDKTYAYILVG
jgi:uncharacterized lipoprotein YbaY